MYRVVRRGFDKAAALFQQGAAREIRDIMLRIDRYVVLGTPVDTGRARSNWLPSIGAPRDDTYFEEYDTGSFVRPSNEDPAKAFRSFPLAARLYLTNSLPYIEHLNEEHYTSALFVERGITNGVRSYMRERRRRR